MIDLLTAGWPQNTTCQKQGPNKMPVEFFFMMTLAWRSTFTIIEKQKYKFTHNLSYLKIAKANLTPVSII